MSDTSSVTPVLPSDNPTTKVDYITESIDDLDEPVEVGRTDSPLLGTYVGDGETKFVRLLTKEVVTLDVHFGVKLDPAKPRAVRCNGKPCVLCLAQVRAATTQLLPVFYLDEAALGILRFYKDDRPGSLRTQLRPLLRQPNYLDLVVTVKRTGWQYTVAINQTRDRTSPEDDPAYYGDDVLRDLLARGGIAPADVAATIEKHSNQELLDAVPRLAGSVKARHPGIDLTAL